MRPYRHYICLLMAFCAFVVLGIILKSNLRKRTKVASDNISEQQTRFSRVTGHRSKTTIQASRDRHKHLSQHFTPIMPINKKPSSTNYDNTGQTTVQTDQNFPHCIEENICKNLSRSPDIYYYTRTDFDLVVEEPVNIKVNISNSHAVIPKTVHFCLFSNRSTKFRFHYMIAILAASRIVNPHKIYFWHDNLPRGKYWEETRRRVKNLYPVHRDRPTEIRGNPVTVIEHVADVVRLEALLEYGGIYLDMDSIVVNPVDPLLVYDVTMGHAVRMVLANGIMFSVPWSAFFKIWHKEYKTFKDKEWGSHSVIKPFQLSRIYPNLIHIEPTALCRPNWQELDYLFGSKPWDWKKYNYVVHLYMRFGPKVEHNPENIKTWNTTAGSIMRYIYYGDDRLIP